MDELRRNQIVKLILKSNVTLEGEVVDYAKDRVKILIFPYSIDMAKQIKELDDLKVFVSTHLGLKEMKSSVIDPLNSLNCITIENNPTVQVVQKRAFVRVLSDINFKLSKNNMLYNCVCVNISAGGVAFNLKNSDIALGDDVIVILPAKYFEKEIMLSAKIIKQNDDWYVAQFINANPRDEDRIIKYVFKTIVKH